MTLRDAVAHGALESARAQKDRDKARLLRWTPDGELEVVYETKGLGDAFLAPPTCGDGVLTVTAYAEGGDERVWATVPG